MSRRKGDGVDRYAEERLAKQRARNLARSKPREVTVEVWLSAGHLLFPSTANEKSVRHRADMLRPFRRAHGKLRMWDLSPLVAQAWALKHPSQVPYLRTAWGKAVLMQVAPINVWLFVQLPKRKKEKRRPPTQVELDGILLACQQRDDQWFAETFRDMVLMAAYSGARESGLIGLRRDCVDLDAGRMTLTEKGSKTRVVALVGPALAAARRSVARWEDRERYVVSGHRQPLLWVGPRYRRARVAPRRPLTAEVVQSSWRSVRGRFPHGFHALKHFAGTWLREQGVDELDVAIQLGHTDSEGRPYPSLVRRVYNHPDPELALERISGRVSP